jgi:hypothetical protein
MPLSRETVSVIGLGADLGGNFVLILPAIAVSSLFAHWTADDLFEYQAIATGGWVVPGEAGCAA